MTAQPLPPGAIRIHLEVPADQVEAYLRWAGSRPAAIAAMKRNAAAAVKRQAANLAAEERNRMEQARIKREIERDR